MTDSEFAYVQTLGERRDQLYSIGVRLDPSIDSLESFAAILFFQLEDGTRVEVLKIDDSSHEGRDDDIHIDRYYRELGAVIKEFDTDIGGWEDAHDFIEFRWEDYVDRYYRNHGLAPREDGAN